jgi:SAM-dependent methyltransferase
MVARSAACSRRLAFLSIVLLCSTILISAEKKVWFLSFAEVSETLRLFADSGLPGSDIADATSWDRWIRNQDAEVRGRIDRGVEDSISNLILYGTSYTGLPRLEGPGSSVTEAGKISEAARARVHALIVAVGAAAPNERVRMVRDFLRRKGIAPGGVQEFLAENLERFAIEQRSYQKKLEEAGNSGDPGQVMLARGTLYQTRGLSADTSLLPNFALEDSLRVLASKGVLAPGKIRRIAVIGPGLDFSDKRDGYDFYPLQTIQPFAVMEAVLRQKLGKAEEIEVVTLDLNPGVNAHVARLARDARAGRAYTVQLPRDMGADWAPAAVAYWEHFGETLGTPAKPIPVPQALGGVALRAMAIAPRYASRVTPMDLNVVTQRVELEQGQGFDLVIATNILVYYDLFQQALAMASIARMMNPGGIFLANNALPAQHAESLEFLGRRTVAYATNGSYGDDVVVYRRR